MLTKLKCFFGFHDWEYSDQEGPHHGRVLRKRKCKRKDCGMNQKEVLIRCYDSNNTRVVWRFNPVWSRPPRERPMPKSSVPDKPTLAPMPECKEPMHSEKKEIDVRIELSDLKLDFMILENQMLQVFVSTNERKTRKIAGKALNMKGFK